MIYPNRIIKMGESDPFIMIAVQEELTHKGILVEATGTFDFQTRVAVKSFQAVSRDRNGNPLVIDGILGPVTWAVLFTEDASPAPAGTDPFLQKAIDIARGEIGVTEDPPYSNRGKRISEYLRSIGLDPGYPWCAAFVYWCFHETAKQTGRVNPLVKTGSCLVHWNSTRGRKFDTDETVNNPTLIRPGVIFINNHGGGRGHTGIVVETSGGFITTVEGNSNPTGSREGLGVCQLSRKINSISMGFIDYGERA